MLGRQDGNAVARYTGKELPRPAQRVKPAPQALSHVVDWDKGGIRDLMTSHSCNTTFSPGFPS